MASHLDIPDNFDPEDEIEILGTRTTIRDWLFNRDLGWQNSWRLAFFAFILGFGAALQRMGWVWYKVIGEGLVAAALVALIIYLANVGLIDIAVSFSHALFNRMKNLDFEEYEEDEFEEYEAEEVTPVERPRQPLTTLQPQPVQQQPTFVAPPPITAEQRINQTEDAFKEHGLEKYLWYQNLKKHSYLRNNVRYLVVAGKEPIEVPDDFDHRWIVMLSLKRYQNGLDALSGRILQQEGFSDRRSESLKSFMNWLEESNLIQRGNNNLMQFTALGNVIFLPHPNPPKPDHKLDQAGS